jgi:hypothetical protein
MPGREQNVREDAALVQREPTLGRPNAADARALEALVPIRLETKLLDMLQELLDRRVEAVADALGQRYDASPSKRRPHRKAREGGRPAMAVALGPHPPLTDRRRANAPGGSRIPVCSEHGYFGRLEPPFSEGCIGDEPGEPASDDPAHSRHCYFTEPASRPWTK